MTTGPIDRQRRLALLLADGSGDYDFVSAIAVLDVVYLEGRVTSYAQKQHAEDLARHVGFDEVRNMVRVVPGEDAAARSTNQGEFPVHGDDQLGAPG